MMTRQELSMTPTISGMPVRHGDFLTVTDALAYAAQTQAGFNFFNVFGQLTSVLTYNQLQQQAMQVAVHLKHLGLPRNSRLAIIAETSPEFLIVFFACQYAGIVPCPIAFSVNLGGMPTYIAKLTQLLHGAQVAVVVCTENIEQYIEKAASIAKINLLTIESLLEHAQQNETPSLSELTPFGAEEAAYIQFSSGSTTQPKGVQITQHALHTNVNAVLRYGMKLRAEDRSFNWLPFHHNMGLVGFVFGSVYGQRSVDCLSAENFMQDPMVWLELMSRYHTGITFAPVFGYQLVMKKFMESPNRPNLDLSSIRIAGIGGDMISAEILSSFSECFAASGFKHQAFLPSYGMTETTLAVTTADTESELITNVLKDSHPPKEIVSCGKPLPGFEVKIIDPDTQAVLPERITGQIWVKGPSIITTYIGHEHEILSDADGFIYTGDLGHFIQGQLFISGREKDVIIIRGRNIWSQDVEWLILQACPQIGAGNVAAIGVPADAEEILVVLVSLENPHEPGKAVLTRTICQTLSQTMGIHAQVFFVAEKLPATPSGKLARTKAKQNYLNNAFTLIETDMKEQLEMDSLLKAKEILSKCLLIPAEQIEDEDTIEKIKPVDSVIFASIVMEVERFLQKEIDVTEWLELSSVKDLAGILQKNQTP